MKVRLLIQSSTNSPFEQQGKRESLVISLFPLIAASYVAENMASLKNRSEAVTLMTSLFCNLTLPGIFCQKVAQRCPIRYAEFQRYLPSGGPACMFEGKLMWELHQHPCPGRELNVLLAGCFGDLNVPY